MSATSSIAEQILALRDARGGRPTRGSTGWSIRSPLPIMAAGPAPFHETPKGAFLRSLDISCYSLIALAQAFKDHLAADASVVALVDFDHADGQRELRLHGPDQGGARFVAGLSGQVVQPVFPRAVQRRRARAC